MRPTRQSALHDDQEVVARLMQERDLVAVPVVDARRRLVGIVTVDARWRCSSTRGTEDISRVAGASEPFGVPYHAVSIRALVRTRIV